MIKQKNDLLKVNPPVTDLQNLFVNYLKSISLEDVSGQYRDARKRLELARQASQSIKENMASQKEKQDGLLSKVAEPCVKENSPDIQAQTSLVSCSVVNSPDDKEKLQLFLDEMADNRKKNELIYGYKEDVFLQEVDDKQWGIEASETAGYYKKNLGSTITRGRQGWSEFGITYDNTFFLKYSTTGNAENHQFDFNHQTMGCGTFLKAAGKIKIENDQLIISPYSQYLELGPRYIAIIFFVLREKGFVFSDENCCIANEEGDSISYMRVGNPIPLLDSVSYYLDEARFPLAKTIAENKNLSIESRLSELFLSIDDEILSTRSQDLINVLNTKKAELKTDIIDFLLLIINTSLSKETPPKKEMKIILEGNTAEKSLATEETAYQCYNKVMDSIQTFQTEHRIDFSFINNELSSWFYYISALSFKAESKFEDDEKEKIVEELRAIEKGLLKIIEVPTIIPQRFIESDAATASFLQFYTEDPIKTCIALLHDYTKGSFFWRFFSGAWNRHHVDPVEQFLRKYRSNHFADNLSIQDIYRELFKVQGTLTEYSGKRGTLFARLQFCAKLANEIQNESATPDLAASFAEISEGSRVRSETVFSEISTALTAESSSPSALAAVLSSMPVNEAPIAIDKPERPKSLRKSVVFSPPSHSDELPIYEKPSSKNNSPQNSSIDPPVFSSLNMGNY